MENSELLEVIGRLEFRFAKTMPHIPHWYVVRSPENEEDYKRLFYATLDGEWSKWRGRPLQYLYPGDGYKYWRMTDDISESKIINRAKA